MITYLPCISYANELMRMSPIHHIDLKSRRNKLRILKAIFVSNIMLGMSQAC